MAYENTRDTVEGLVAGADLSEKQFHICRYAPGAVGTVILAAAASENLVGILQNKPKSGEAATVSKGGVSKCVAGGESSINAGDYITADANGQAQAALAGEVVVGIALEDATDGQLFSVDCDRTRA